MEHLAHRWMIAEFKLLDGSIGLKKLHDPFTPHGVAPIPNGEGPRGHFSGVAWTMWALKTCERADRASALERWAAGGLSMSATAFMEVFRKKISRPRRERGALRLLPSTL